MTPTNKLLKQLTGADFSCSRSSTPAPAPAPASIDQRYSMLTADVGSSGRAIDRFSPHLCDPLRAKSFNREPKPYKSPKSEQQLLLISPATSARYLLSESASISEEDLWDSVPSARMLQPVAKLQQSTVRKPELEQSTHTYERISPSSSSVTGPQNQQVVVLWVSLHCKGCEEKVRKHISKMEGVTSFTTDLENKKVTVIGDVNPLGVLNSISKVKNAQLWRSDSPSASSFDYTTQ